MRSILILLQKVYWLDYKYIKIISIFQIIILNVNELRKNYYLCYSIKNYNTMKECVLVSGGAGFIGSHTAVELIQAGFDVVIAEIGRAHV